MSRSSQLPYFPLSLYGWKIWLPILAVGAAAGLISYVLYWPLMVADAVIVLALLAFFRDIPRSIPGKVGIMVAPADGKITEITRVDHLPWFGGPALKIGIFLSVLDVHINRSPCDGTVISTRFEHGLFLDARHPESGKKNQSNTILLAGPGKTTADVPVAVVRQVAGAIARRIICPLHQGESVVRGQRIGMIAFGSRTELIVPHPDQWQPMVQVGMSVKGGSSVLLQLRD